MATTYCSVDDVRAFLQLDDNFDPETSPTNTQIENIIKRKEDRIDNKLNHGWRTKTSREMFINASFIDMRNGVRFDLPDYSIKTLTNGTDTLEVWDGNAYVDFLANKTEGRDEDYWLDEDKGVLFIKTGVQRATKKPIRIQYRYGETTVDGTIKDLCILLTAIDILKMYEKVLMFSDDGSANKPSNTQRIEFMKQEVKELWNELSFIGTF